MKKLITPIVSFVKKQSKRTKFIALGVVVAFIMSGSVFALTRPEPQQPVVQNQGQTQQEERPTEVVAAATTEPQPSASEQQPTQSATPAKPTAQPKPAKPNQQPVHNNSTALPAAIVKPVAPPAPAPGYYIEIDYGSMTQTGPNQAHIQFNIIREAGYVGSLMASCSMLSAPLDSHGVSCDTSIKEANYGFILLLIPDTASAGDFVGQLTLTDGSLVRTAQFGFTLVSD